MTATNQWWWITYSLVTPGPRVSLHTQISGVSKGVGRKGGSGGAEAKTKVHTPSVWFGLGFGGVGLVG